MDGVVNDISQFFGTDTKVPVKAFDDAEFLADVAKIRFALVSLMKKYNLLSNINEKSGTPNPFHMRIDRNRKAAYAVEFFNGVIPQCIYTPFGAIDIEYSDSDNFVRYQRAAEVVNEKTKMAFMADLQKLFDGCVVRMTSEPKDKMHKENGPVVYGFTKVPWSGEIRGDMYQIAHTTKDMNGEIDYAERKQYAEIVSKVNNDYVKKGYPEFNLTVPTELEQKKEPVTAQVNTGYEKLW